MANFCTKCGKRLEEGEICNCTAQAEQPVQPQYEQPVQPQYEQPVQPQYDQQQQYQQAQPQYDQQQQYQQAQPQYDQQQQYQQAQPQSDQQQQYQQAQPQYQQQQYQQQYQQGPTGQTREAEWFNEAGAKVAGGAKNMFNAILPILKQPVTGTQNIAASNSPAVGLSFIGVKSAIALIIMLISAARLSSVVGGYIDIPYFKLIVLVLLTTAGIDALEAVTLKFCTAVGNGLTNTNAMFSVVGARALYETIILLATSIIGLLLPKFAFVLYLLAAIGLAYIEFGAYRAVVQADENKKVYTFIIAKIVIAIVTYLIVYLFMKNIAMGLLGNVLGGLNSLF